MFAVQISFLLWGALCSWIDSMIISGVNDILAGTDLPTSIVIISLTCALGLTYAAGPDLVIKIPYPYSVTLAFLSSLGGILAIASGSNAHWKLFGVVLVGLGTGYGITILLSLAPFFPDEMPLAAYSAGTGIGWLAALLYYTAMTTWLCISPTIALIISTPLCFLFFVCYYVINKNRAVTTNRKAVYSKIKTMASKDSEDKTSNSGLSGREKLNAISTLLIYTSSPVFIAFFSEYVLLQSIVSTLAYPNSPFRPRDHYQYYFITFWFGEVLTRSHRVVLGLVKTKYLYPVTLCGLWVLAILEALLMMVLLFESWFRFLSSIGVVLAICFSAGMIVGLVFSNSLELLCQKLNDVKQRQYGMGMYNLPLIIGILFAGLIGLRLEAQLREHCMDSLVNDTFCFTRSKTFEDITARCGT